MGRQMASMQVPVRPDAPVRLEPMRGPGAALAAVAAGIALVMVVVYLVLIQQQGDGFGLRVFLVAACVVAAGACAAGAAWSSSPDRRRVLMAAAAGGLLSLGIIGMWSIGLPLFVGGVLAMLGSVRLARSVGRGSPRFAAASAGVAAFLVPVAVLFTPR